jgi:hypothetical protein
MIADGVMWSAAACRRCLPPELARACCNREIRAGLRQTMRFDPGLSQARASSKAVLQRHPSKAAGASPGEAEAGASSRTPHAPAD